MADLVLQDCGVERRYRCKIRGGVDDWEGQALVYLERYVPEVPAPRLYAMYYDSKQVFLIMQRVPGVPLDSIWPFGAM